LLGASHGGDSVQGPTHGNTSLSQSPHKDPRLSTQYSIICHSATPPLGRHSAERIIAGRGFRQ